MKRVNVELIDDLDGSVLHERDNPTVTFSLGSDHFEIDLSSANRARLSEALAPFIAVARKVNGTKLTQRPSRTSASIEVAAVRSWARASGHTIGAKGRIPKGILQAYQAGHES